MNQQEMENLKEGENAHLSNSRSETSASGFFEDNLEAAETVNVLADLEEAPLGLLENRESSLSLIFQADKQLLLCTQVREEVELCTVNHHLEVVSEEQKKLDEAIADGDNTILEYQQVLHQNLYDREQLNEEIEMSKALVDIFQQNYEVLEKNNSYINEEIELLELNCKDLFDEYISETSKLKNSIQVKELLLKSRKDELANLKAVFETKVKTREINLNVLYTEQAKINDEIERATSESKTVEDELDQNNKLLQTKIKENEELETAINAIDLNSLQSELDVLEKEEERITEQFKVDKERAKMMLEELANQKIHLEETSRRDSSEIEEMQEQLEKIVEEKASLLSSQNEIKAAVTETELKSQEVRNLHEKQMKILDSDSLKMHESLDWISRAKNEKLNDIQQLSQHINTDNETLARVIDSISELEMEMEAKKKNVEKVQIKNRDMETAIANDKKDVLDKKKICADVEESLQNEVKKQKYDEDEYAKILSTMESEIQSRVSKTNEHRFQVEDDYLKHKMSLEKKLSESKEKLQVNKNLLMNKEKQKEEFIKLINEKRQKRETLKRNLKSVTNSNKRSLPLLPRPTPNARRVTNSTSVGRRPLKATVHTGSPKTRSRTKNLINPETTVKGLPRTTTNFISPPSTPPVSPESSKNVEMQLPGLSNLHSSSSTPTPYTLVQTRIESEKLKNIEAKKTSTSLSAKSHEIDTSLKNLRSIVETDACKGNDLPLLLKPFDFDQINSQNSLASQETENDHYSSGDSSW